MKKRSFALNLSLMLIMVSFCPFVAIAGFLNTSLSVNYWVKGKVMSSDSIPLENAVVSLVSLPDSTLINLATTTLDGSFNLGTYCFPVLLHVEKPAFEKVDMVIENHKEVSVVLSPISTELAEFTVKAKRNGLTAKPGMYVFDPSDMYKHFDNAFNMMTFVPLVSEFSKREVKIFSKNGNAKIFVNGEDPMLPNDVILDKLRAIPPKKIKKVEIIMYPSSMQGQEHASSGIINIILDDDFKGWNASIYADTYFFNRRFNDYNINGYWFYQNHNFLFNVFPHYTLNDKRQEFIKTVFDDESNIDREVKQDSRVFMHRLGVSMTAEYRFKENSIAATFGITTEKSEINSIYSEKYIPISLEVPGTDAIVTKVSESSNLTPWNCDLYGALRFRRFFCEDRSAKLDIYGLYTTKRPSNMTDVMREFSFGSSEYQNPVISQRNQSYRNQNENQVVRANFSKTFSDRSVFNIGVSFYNNMLHNSYVDPESSYDFKLNKLTAILNGEYERKWVDFFSTRIGFNEYYINRKIEERVAADKYKANFNIFQPYVITTFIFGKGQNSLSLIYQKQVVTPNDNDLNPYKRWVSATEYWVGNPNLKPLTAHLFTLAYSWASQLFVTCVYSTGHNNVEGYRFMDGEGNIVETTLPNEEFKNFRANLGWSKSFFSYRWQLNPTFSLNWENSKADLGTEWLSNHAVSYEFSLSNKVRILPRYGFSGNIDYRFSGESRNLTVKSSATHKLYIRLRKNLWPNAEISGSLTVPLNRPSITFISPGMEEKRVDKFGRDIRLYLNFSWSFGKFTIERVNKI